MIDNIGMTVKNISPSSFGDMMSGLAFNVFSTRGDITKVDWYNMRITYVEHSNSLFIKNSLHKFYNAIFGNKLPDNSTDFTISQFSKISEFIAESLGVDVRDIIVQGSEFEFGVNTEMDKNTAIKVMRKYQSYQDTSINDFYVKENWSGGKPIQWDCYLTEYKLKTYFKNEIKVGKVKMKSEREVMRLEIVAKELRQVRKFLGFDTKSEITLFDLMQHNTWENMAHCIISKYDRIKKIPMVEGMTMAEIDAINAYSSQNYYEAMKSVMSEALFKKTRLQQKEIYDRLDQLPDNLHNQIRTKIAAKIAYLIAN